MDGDEEFEQARFFGGKVVADSSSELSAASVEGLVSELVVEDSASFRLLVREGAREANQWIGKVEAEYGDVWGFQSRADAEQLVDVFTATGGELRIQAAPENESSEIDAYLLAGYSPSTTEPESVVDGTWSFDVGANLYGSLGETVVLSGPPYPALETYISEELDLDRDAFKLAVCRDVDRVLTESVDGGTETWVPDCEVVVYDGASGRERERFLGEIKTGSASFQRSQATVMAAVAETQPVLKIRVTIDSLPDSYSVRITSV